MENEGAGLNALSKHWKQPTRGLHLRSAASDAASTAVRSAPCWGEWASKGMQTKSKQEGDLLQERDLL